MVLQKGENAHAEQEAIKGRLEKIRAEWPSLVPQALKDRIITMFRQQTSSETLKSVTCAACAESCLASHQYLCISVSRGFLTSKTTKNHKKPQKTHKKTENTETSELESVFVETTLNHMLRKLQKPMETSETYGNLWN
jgi:hypothetical protein